VGTVGGMLIGTIALLIIVPALFIVFQYIEEKVMPSKRREEEDKIEENTIEEINDETETI
jgi:HAE1 family hydrophobic/amphiphilic exporter-1